MNRPAIDVRRAGEADAPAMLDIYAPIVRATAISFELEPPTLDDFRARVRKALQGWEWLVAERDGQLLGYAYGSAHRERAAYRWSVETSAYVAPAAQRLGVGGRLYAQLLPRLAALGYCNAFAGIALPNEASVALHRRAGFREVGVFPTVGHKLGRWHDVGWYHARLREEPPAG